jgi:hypothetical protein
MNEWMNVISILLGWDGLGLVSYLLVIYHQNVRSYGAGAYATWQRPTTTRPTTFHVCKTRGSVCSFRLLIMGGVSPETCWASLKIRNDKILIHCCILLGFHFKKCVISNKENCDYHYCRHRPSLWQLELQTPCHKNAANTVSHMSITRFNFFNLSVYNQHSMSFSCDSYVLLLSRPLHATYGKTLGFNPMTTDNQD